MEGHLAEACRDVQGGGHCVKRAGRGRTRRRSAVVELTGVDQQEDLQIPQLYTFLFPMHVGNLVDMRVLGRGGTHNHIFLEREVSALEHSTHKHIL